MKDYYKTINKSYISNATTIKLFHYLTSVEFQNLNQCIQMCGTYQ